MQILRTDWIINTCTKLYMNSKHDILILHTKQQKSVNFKKIHIAHRWQNSNLNDCPDAKVTSSRNSSRLHLICLQSPQLSLTDEKVAIFRKQLPETCMPIKSSQTRDNDRQPAEGNLGNLIYILQK